METSTSLEIGQFAEYLRGLTQRLDPGAGWYGEFLRRDPDGVRACLDGAALPPWDVVESLLRDLAAARGEELAAREGAYAARLRASAVGAWDGLPGAAERLRTEHAAAAAQRAAAQAAVRNLTARLGAAADPVEADALARELSWTHDDEARATARHEDLASRLAAHGPAATPGSPLPGVPRQRTPRPWPPAPPPTGAPVRSHAQAPAPARADADSRPPADPPAAAHVHAPAWAPAEGEGWPLPEGAASDVADPGAAPDGQGPVGRAEGRWLRGRRAGGARYAGMAESAAQGFAPPPGHPLGGGEQDGAAEFAVPAPRGARFGRGPTAPEPPAATAPTPTATPTAAPTPTATPTAAPTPAPTAESPTARPPSGDAREVVGELTALRAQGRGGEAHALLCEIAAWPADQLPGLAGRLARAGLAADWATLLWEVASLPPERLAAAAAALGESGREADCDRLLRQGVARPTAEIADAALALGASGRTREADTLLGAFVRVRTAEEAAALARRDPRWFAPRLLQAAAETSATHHRDLVHALRVAGIATA
ncbi:hypothetical protein ACTVZO_32100 [Streptomyces sp. IBSNAI002]|uniref:hypothetical protein n=1 Tax=Streptomyces sp. IBSNAI002 TaxID=3457500 RepID=UPI003FD509B1